MDFEPTLSARFIAYVRDYLLDHKVEPGPVFEACCIPARDNEEDDTPLPVPQVAMLLEKAAEVTDNPRMGMNMGQHYHYEASSMLILAMLSASSVEAAIKCLSRYDKHVDTGIEIVLDYGQSLAEFGARVIAADHVKINQLNEYLMVFLAQTLNIATRKKMPISAVWFSHNDDQNLAALESFFGAPVKYSQHCNKLIFERAFLQERLYTSNSLLHDTLDNALKTYFLPTDELSEFVDRVSREIIRCASDVEISTERIAERLAISPRTLRRRLSEEGYSFQGAKNLAREKRAKYYLSHTSMPISEITFELGYSELSAFSRAFRSWVGVTPQDYRRRSRELLRA
jgi:AraC-like DNA-binding protein